MNSPPASVPIFAVLACTHATAPLAVREKLAIAPERVGAFYVRLRKLPGIMEAVVLSTCNRVEIYVVATDIAENILRESILLLLAGHRSLAVGVVAAHCRWHSGLGALQHLYQVAAGVDSQMVGETEILGQVRDAYADALNRQGTGTMLNRIFQKSFQAAAWVRTHTDIGRGQVSVGNIAVELATRIFGELDESRVLVLGTGEVGRKTAQAFVSRGAPSIAVASRTFDNARMLAETIGGTAIEMESALHSFERYDIIIGSAATTTSLVTADAVRMATRSRAGEPLFLIDLGLPRNFPPDSGTISGVYLYNLDDLSAIANENLRMRQVGVEHAKLVLAEKANQLWTRLTGKVRPVS